MPQRPPCGAEHGNMHSTSPASRPTPYPRQHGRLRGRHGRPPQPVHPSASMCCTALAALRQHSAVSLPPNLLRSPARSSARPPLGCCPTIVTALLCVRSPRSCRTSCLVAASALSSGRGGTRAAALPQPWEQETLVAVPDSREEALVLLEQLQRVRIGLKGKRSLKPYVLRTIKPFLPVGWALPRRSGVPLWGCRSTSKS